MNDEWVRVEGDPDPDGLPPLLECVECDWCEQPFGIEPEWDEATP